MTRDATLDALQQVRTELVNLWILLLEAEDGITATGVKMAKDVVQCAINRHLRIDPTREVQYDVGL